MITIYKYTSPSGKHYVGQTCKSTQRGRAERDGKGYQSCPLFWRAIQKYGWDNFQYEILEKVESREEANAREIYYIQLYKSNNPEFGYNTQAGGEQSGNFEYLQRLEGIKKMWEEGKTVGEIQKYYGLSQQTLCYEMQQLNIDGKERIKRSAGQYLAKLVYQYDLNLNLIATYNSTAEAERATGILNIRRSCAKNEEIERPKYKSGGYYWTYRELPGPKNS